MKLGYIQEEIIRIAKEKGFITSTEVLNYYPQKESKRQMTKLISLGFFESPEDCITYIKWNYTGKEL